MPVLQVAVAVVVAATAAVAADKETPVDVEECCCTERAVEMLGWENMPPGDLAADVVVLVQPLQAVSLLPLPAAAQAAVQVRGERPIAAAGP